jgi:predicted flavoprotein YhiN
MYENMASKRPRKVRTSGYFDCDAVMLATGKSTSGLSLAQHLGHDVVPTFPSLFSFRFQPRSSDGAGGNTIAEDAGACSGGAGGGAAANGPTHHKKNNKQNSNKQNQTRRRTREHKNTITAAAAAADDIAAAAPSLAAAATTPFLHLQGIHLSDVGITFAGKSARGPLHVTHSGIAGPAVLHLSSLAAEDMAACGHWGDLRVDLLPHLEYSAVRGALRTHAAASSAAALLTGKRKTKATYPRAFRGHLTRALWRALVVHTAAAAADAEALLWVDLTEAHEMALARALTGDLVVPLRGVDASAHEAGGVDLAQVDPVTMESLVQPGLFFGGSVLNMDGVSRGFNFQASWSTGHAAGRGMAVRLF